MKTEELITEARALPKQFRRDFIANHCTNLEIGQYFKRYDIEDQVVQERELSLRTIELSRVEEEFEAVKAEWKAKIKFLKENWKKSLTVLKQNGEWLDGEQFMFADQKRGVMEYYDSNGDFISSRRLLPEERQMTIFEDQSFVANAGLIAKSDKIGE
jgi:hypothetical protein